MNEVQLPNSVSYSTLGPYDFSGNEVGILCRQIYAGDYTGINWFLDENLKTRNWDDRAFVLGQVLDAVNSDSLNAACAADPGNYNLHLLLGCWLQDMIGKSRGANTADDTTREQFDAAFEYLRAATSCLAHAASLQPDDPTPHMVTMRAMIISSQFESRQKEEYTIADRLAPHFVSLQFAYVLGRSEKWLGSHEESLQVARSAMRKAKPGDDMAACLFQAHFLVWQYYWIFKKDAAAAAAYLKNPGATLELNAAFDRWTNQTYRPTRSSIPRLHYAALWYYKAEDQFRLRRTLEMVGNMPNDDIWKQIGNVQKRFSDAMNLAYGLPREATAPAKPAGKSGLFGLFKK
jgi:hypothetical protein